MKLKWTEIKAVETMKKGVDGLLGTYRRIFSDEPRTLEGINAGSELECQRHQILKRSCSSLRTAA